MDTNNAIFKGMNQNVAPTTQPVVQATGASALGEQDYSKLQDKILGEIHDPSTYIDTSDPNKFLSDILNKTMKASEYNPVSGVSGALGKLSMSPEVLAQMKGGDLIPGVAPKTISAIGTMAKSFQEGYDNARGAKVDPSVIALASKIKTEAPDKPKISGNGGVVMKLKGDFDKAAAPYVNAIQGYNKVISAAKDPSPAGDISLIFAYMKTLDPTSVVREGEFATAANAGSVPERVVVQYNKAMEGTRLIPAQRADFVNKSRALVEAAEVPFIQAKNTTIGLSKYYGIDPELIMTDYTSGALNPELSQDYANSTSINKDRVTKPFKKEQSVSTAEIERARRIVANAASYDKDTVALAQELLKGVK